MPLPKSLQSNKRLPFSHYNLSTAVLVFASPSSALRGALSPSFDQNLASVAPFELNCGSVLTLLTKMAVRRYG